MINKTKFKIHLVKSKHSNSSAVFYCQRMSTVFVQLINNDTYNTFGVSVCVYVKRIWHNVKENLHCCCCCCGCHSFNHTCVSECEHWMEWNVCTVDDCIFGKFILKVGRDYLYFVALPIKRSLLYVHVCIKCTDTHKHGTCFRIQLSMEHFVILLLIFSFHLWIARFSSQSGFSFSLSL